MKVWIVVVEHGTSEVRSVCGSLKRAESQVGSLKDRMPGDWEHRHDLCDSIQVVFWYRTRTGDSIWIEEREVEE